MNIQTIPRTLGAATPAPTPTIPAVPPQKSKIELLLDCEAAMRNATTIEELSYLIVSEWRPIISASQIHVIVKQTTGAHHVKFTSDITKPDPRSPLCAKISEHAQILLEGKTANEWHAISFEKMSIDGARFALPFGLGANIAFKDEASSRQIVALSPTPFSDGDRIIAARLAATAAHAFMALTPQRRRGFKVTNKARIAGFSALAIIAVGFIPVPLSILAPVEITAQNPFIAAAPISGVIDSIAVEPNSAVKSGDILFRLNDVELKATLDIAEKSVAVSQARLRRANQGAGASTELRREVGIAQSELALAVAERDGALLRLDRTVVRAPYDGVVMFNRKEDWIGKPVSVGERIMEIADPSRIQASIEVGLTDSIVLSDPQSITLFLDSAPLTPLSASFLSAGFQAEMARNQLLAYPVRAQITERSDNLRIGQRGTAQVRAKNVSLAYFLFRRPLSALRQKVGL